MTLTFRTAQTADGLRGSRSRRLDGPSETSADGEFRKNGMDFSFTPIALSFRTYI
jgi:hypothetical protein